MTAIHHRIPNLDSRLSGLEILEGTPEIRGICPAVFRQAGIRRQVVYRIDEGKTIGIGGIGEAVIG